MAKKVAAKTRSYTIIESSGLLFQEVKTMKNNNFLEAPSPDAPMMIEDHDIDVPDSLLKSLADLVETGFKCLKSYTGTGRGAQMMEPKEKADTNSLFGIIAKKTGSKLLGKIDKNEKSYVETPWYFGYASNMHGCGPEFAMVSSLKCTVMG